MDYSKFTIKSGGLETISDLTKEECFESALNKIEEYRKHGWGCCLLSFNEYGLIYKELRNFLESNNYIVCAISQTGFNEETFPRLYVEWIDEDLEE